MTSGLRRFINSVKENMSCESYNKLIESLGYIDDKASLEKRAIYK